MIKIKKYKQIYSEIIGKLLKTFLNSAPKKLSSMFDLAEKLSSPFDYVRVDLYHENNKIYFGELTFFPECGYNSITYKADQVFGKRLKINTNQKFEFF